MAQYPYISTGRLPAADRIRDLMKEAHRRFQSNDDGENARVYPALADASAPKGEAAVAAAPAVDYDGQLNQARSLVSQDPARVAQVVKTWVGGDE